jgi:hypothetical protein
VLDEVIHMLLAVRDAMAADTHAVLCSTASVDSGHSLPGGQLQRLRSIDSVELRDPLEMDSKEVQ